MCESTSFKSLEFIWKITNFSQQKLTNGPGKRIRSRAGVSNGETWASLFLDTVGSKKYFNSHHFEFSILDKNREKFGIRHFHRKIPITRGYLKFIRLTDLLNPANKMLPNDTLTICCRVEETESESRGCATTKSTKMSKFKRWYFWYS